jgi:hypothetical protein
MLKNWKSLFVKTDETETQKNEKTSEPLSFPVNTSSQSFPQTEASIPVTQAVNDPSINEVLQVYENGLDSINMPGYDFFEFYKAITSTGTANEQTYNMAYQMAKTMDKTITSQKLLSDAEFYISKINEVHSQYVTQGQQKLNSIQDKKSAEKSQLHTEIDQGTMRLAQLRVELQELEASINKKRNSLNKIDETYYSQEKSIREKLNANDMAKTISIGKLNSIRDGIQRFVKDR